MVDIFLTQHFHLEFISDVVTMVSQYFAILGKHPRATLLMETLT